MTPSAHIHRLPAFADNYLWMIHDPATNRAAAVDPGDPALVLSWLTAYGATLTDILITHHHPDHVGGIEALVTRFDSLPVMASAYDCGRNRVPRQTLALADGDEVTIMAGALSLQVIAVPGHTLGHVAYHCAELGALFCGDTLFLGGCGRLREGTPQTMHSSLARFDDLHHDTYIYCAHEYTETNYSFAAQIMPDDPAVRARLAHTRDQRRRGLATVPASLGEERRDNLFLRCAEPRVQAATATNNASDAFAALRRRRNEF